MLKAETVSVWSARVEEADFNKKKQALNVGYKQKLKKKKKTQEKAQENTGMDTGNFTVKIWNYKLH